MATTSDPTKEDGLTETIVAFLALWQTLRTGPDPMSSPRTDEQTGSAGISARIHAALAAGPVGA